MDKERLEEGLHGCGRRHETLSPPSAQTSEFLITCSGAGLMQAPCGYASAFQEIPATHPDERSLTAGSAHPDSSPYPAPHSL